MPSASSASSAEGLPSRIVSLAPNVTEILFALGAGPRVAACTNRCNYPPEVAPLPRIGDVTLDFERILAMAPDLVVAESITTDKDVARLRSLGLNVLKVDSGTLEGYYTTLKTLGERTGTAARATALAASLRRTVERLGRQAGGPSPPGVFVEIQARPLIGAGRGTFIDEMVTLAGGKNILSDVAGSYPQIDPEAIVARDPRVVVVTIEGDPEEFGRRPGFSRLTAVRRHAVHVINPDLLVRPSPRLEQGLALLARWIEEARQESP